MIHQQEEAVQALDPVRGADAAGVAIELRLRKPLAAQRLHARLGAGTQLVQRSELDGVSGAGFRARRLHSALEAIVTKSALVGLAVLLHADGDDAVGAARHAVVAAVADVLLDQHGAELRAGDGAGGTRLQAAGVRAVLADIALEQPAGRRAFRRSGVRAFRFGTRPFLNA